MARVRKFVLECVSGDRESEIAVRLRREALPRER